MTKRFRPLGQVRSTTQSWAGPGNGLTTYVGDFPIQHVHMKVRTKTLEEAALRIAQRMYGTRLLPALEVRQTPNGAFRAFSGDFAYGEPFYVSKEH
jgi:hypothetical protein